jgi:hypothetical protein
MRSFSVITYWDKHGYFASGGLMSFDVHLATPQTPRVFYKSSSGAYMITGYIVEKIVLLTTHTYRWRLLALHNEVLMMITSALAALLVFRLLMRLGIVWRDALVFSIATQIVFITFPDVLAQYWELGAQAAAMPFALLFLILEDALSAEPARRGLRVAQAIAAFCLVYIESVFGVFFLATYGVFAWLIDTNREALSHILLKTAIPAAAALVLFSAQLTWVRAHLPDVPLKGSEFMFRSGLDGSTQYYRDHLDIIYGREVARRNFPVNRQYLFNWSGLFVAGMLATVGVIAVAARQARLRPILLALVGFAGAYVLYAALFSQAVVIHPYLYDIFSATPLIFALFAFAPGIAESRFRTGGVLAFLTIFAAAWFAMVQIRHYAMWYPTAEPTKAQSLNATPDEFRSRTDDVRSVA